jgi:hypothetical protein
MGPGNQQAMPFGYGVYIHKDDKILVFVDAYGRDPTVSYLAKDAFRHIET